MGTVEWEIEDDMGRTHKIRVPNTIYSATNRSRLLSPQHWAQGANDKYPIRYGIWCAMYDDRIVLYWDQRKYKRTAYLLEDSSNVGVICGVRNVEGEREYEKVEKAFKTEFISMPARLETIRHTTDEYENYDTKSESEESTMIAHAPSEQPSTDPTQKHMNTEENYDYFKADYEVDEELINKKLELNSKMQETTDNALIQKSKREYLQWHNKLGHISHGRMKQLIENGNLPRYLNLKDPPICVACLSGKATRKPWRTKSVKVSNNKTTFPGECVAIDQLESSTAGFIGQLRGSVLTNQRYRYATVFVDMYSDYTFIYLHPSITAEETLKAKKAYEIHAESFGVRIKQYHADNGRFQDIAFKEHCIEQGQRLTYCGVNAHFQNGRAERKIRDLQDGARTSLLHAIKKWPTAITINLWPYALRYVNDVNNHIPRKHEQESPIELFSSTKTSAKLHQFQHFGCPVYVLDHKLQAGRKSGMKWKERVRIGVNLGFSPQHAKSVHLILSLTSGCVSPQYHCTFDSSFESLKQHPVPESLWQEKAHFVIKSKSLHEERINNTKTNLSEQTKEHNEQTTIPDEQQVEEEIDPQLNLPDELEPPMQHGSTQTNEEPQADAEVRRSGRIRKAPSRYKDFVMGNQATNQTSNSPINAEVINPPSLLDSIALKSVTDPDTLYLWQARKEPDFPKFMEAMQKEIDDHAKGGHWKIMKKSDVPSDATVLPAVWSMKHKRRIASREIYKWKARLNIDGSRQIQGVHYQDTYSPVVSWPTTCFFLIHALLKGWYTKQIDCVMAFPQAPVERDLYMEIPKGVKLENVENTRDCVLCIIKNLYGQKQAGRVWYQYLTKGLEEMGFIKSKVDKCVFYYKSCLILIYVDDSIIMLPIKSQVQDTIKRISERFNIQEEGDMCEFLGIEMQRKEDGSLSLRQPQRITSILKDLHMESENVAKRTTPSLKTRILHKDAQGESFNESFHYRSIIGKLNYLEKSTRPDLSFAVHQCARFSSDPKKSHATAVIYIGRYLASTKDKGISIKPNSKGFECYVDASHAGDWKQSTAADDPSTARSRTGYVIQFAGYPVVWASRIQTEIALSVTEAEYIALSMAAREILPLLSLAKEVAKLKVIPDMDAPRIRCRIFEDNIGAVEMANVPKMRPRTKHLNVKYHFFRQFVQKGMLIVEHIAGERQMADILTKALEVVTFLKHCKKMMGW
jgi:hypothetical protein